MTAIGSFLTLGIVAIGIAVGCVVGYLHEALRPVKPVTVVYCTKDNRHCAPSVALLKQELAADRAAAGGATAP